MKIEIEIPDFVPPQRIIYIFAGMQKIGWIEPNTRKVFVKETPCSMCGKCCAIIECPDLVKEPGNGEVYRCGRAEKRPFSCCIAEPKNITECTSKYKEME